LPRDHATALMTLATNPAAFWRANGIPMTAATDSQFDPSNAHGGGGIWLYWLTLIGEGFVMHGAPHHAAELLRRFLAMQAAVLAQSGRLPEFYNSDTPAGAGEPGHLAGSAPLRLAHAVFGIQIVDAARVYAGGVFAWNAPVTITQHGVRVTRSADRGTQIEFASGHTVTLPPDSPAQWVIDPQPIAAAAPVMVAAPPVYPTDGSGTPGRVLVQIEVEPDAPKSPPEAPSV
ncbi:MAG: hypothetical protein H7Y11_12725, partial [Armatimonadetes bacterium]|nr:hypothetical protein [Anaerolineae bacterium]